MMMASSLTWTYNIGIDYKLQQQQLYYYNHHRLNRAT